MGRKKNTFRTDFKIVKDKMMPFTQDLADHLGNLQEVDGERPILHDKVMRMVRAMKDGKWSEGQGEISLAQLPSGELYRINGHHRCYARVELGDTHFKPMIRVVTYAVKDEDDLKHLYAKFDNAELYTARTANHLIIMLLWNTPEFAGWSKRTVSAVASGYKFWRYGSVNQSRKTTLEQIAADLRGQYKGIANHAAAVISPIVTNRRIQGHLARMPVFAAIIETMKFPMKAKKFWEGVLDGIFTKKGDPVRYLYVYLMRTGLGQTKRNNKVTNIATSEEMYKVCIRCFNAFAAGRSISKTPSGAGERVPAKGR